jgi:hypothetical protein
MSVDALKGTSLEGIGASWNAVAMPPRPEGSPAEVSETKRQFREKVLLLILDKLVFGLLIVIAAFALNWVLERNRGYRVSERDRQTAGVADRSGLGRPERAGGSDEPPYRSHPTRPLHERPVRSTAARENAATLRRWQGAS